MKKHYACTIELEGVNIITNCKERITLKYHMYNNDFNEVLSSYEEVVEDMKEYYNNFFKYHKHIHVVGFTVVEENHNEEMYYDD